MAALHLRWKDDDGTHEQWVTDQAPAMIGRSAGCFVRIAAPTVSRRHAELARRADGFTVRDLTGGLNRVLVNGELDTDNTRVWGGDTMTLGEVTVEVETVTGITIPGAGVQMQLRWQIGSQLYEQTVLGGDPVLIGRDVRCGIVLSPHTVSRRHAAIVQEGDRFVIEGLTNAINPILVNGTAREQSQVLAVRDEIQLGEVTLVVMALRGVTPSKEQFSAASGKLVRCSNCHRESPALNSACPYCGAELINAETVVR